MGVYKNITQNILYGCSFISCLKICQEKDYSKKKEFITLGIYPVLDNYLT
jgi:hypothetical protein